MEVLLEAEGGACNVVEHVFYPGDVVKGQVRCQQQLDVKDVDVTLSGYYGWISKDAFATNASDELPQICSMFHQTTQLSTITTDESDTAWSFNFILPRKRASNGVQCTLPPSGTWAPGSTSGWRTTAERKGSLHEESQHSLSRNSRLSVLIVRYAIIISYHTSAAQEQRVLKQLTVRPELDDLDQVSKMQLAAFPIVTWQPMYSFRKVMKHYFVSSQRDIDWKTFNLSASIDLPITLSKKLSQPLSMSAECWGGQRSEVDLHLRLVCIRLYEQINTPYGQSKAKELGKVIIRPNVVFDGRQDTFIDLLPNFGLSNFELGDDLVPSIEIGLGPVDSVRHSLEVDAIMFDLASKNSVLQMRCQQTVELRP